MSPNKQPNQTLVTELDRELGRRIRRRRQSMRLSQAMVGAAIGVTFQQVQKYEQAVNRVPASRLPALAKVLCVEIGWFFWGIDTDGNLTAFD